MSALVEEQGLQNPQANIMSKSLECYAQHQRSEAAAGDAEGGIANMRAVIDTHTANDVMAEVGVGALEGGAEGAVFVGQRAARIEVVGDDGVAFDQLGVDVGFGFVSGNSRLKPVEQVGANRDECELVEAAAGDAEGEIANMRAVIDTHTANDVMAEVGVGALEGGAEGAVFVGQRAARIEVVGDDGVAFDQLGVDVLFGFVSGNSRLKPVEQVGAGRDECEMRRSGGGKSGLLVGGKGHGQFLRVGLDIFRYSSLRNSGSRRLVLAKSEEAEKTKVGIALKR